MPRPKKSSSKTKGNSAKTSNGATLGFEQTLWTAADKLRGHLDAAEYKHVVLGLIFLKYISDAFQELYQKLEQEEYADPEERDEYIAENIFWVPQQNQELAAIRDTLLPKLLSGEIRVKDAEKLVEVAA
ncbi:MAG: type I restriction-modification system subunit M N-terminal domain-containing protein [Coleofasciculus chthonoplastes F3-SA18-01]